MALGINKIHSFMGILGLIHEVFFDSRFSDSICRAEPDKFG